MDALTLIVGFGSLLIAFAVAAATLGTDSRDPLPDDHAR